MELAANVESRAHAERGGSGMAVRSFGFEHAAFLTTQSGAQDKLADDAHEQVYWPRLNDNFSKIQ